VPNIVAASAGAKVNIVAAWSVSGALVGAFVVGVAVLSSFIAVVLLFGAVVLVCVVVVLLLGAVVVGLLVPLVAATGALVVEAATGAFEGAVVGKAKTAGELGLFVGATVGTDRERLSG